jgi:arylsulfatase A-like enzyme
MKLMFSSLLAFALAGSVGLAATTNFSPRYNVLFIISDDMRGDLPQAKLPNLDRLASAGVRFERGFCQYPLCCPSRTSLLTGRKPTTTGVVGNRSWYGDAHSDFVSLPRYFKDHGYVTARAGKVFHDGIDDTDAWDEGGEPRFLAGAGSQTNLTKKLQKRAARAPKATSGSVGEAQDTEVLQAVADGKTRAEHSDRFVIMPGNGEEDHDYRVTTKAMELLGKYQDRPFFIALGLSKPHSPPGAPRKFYDLYDVNQIVLPADFAPRPTVPEGFPRLSIRPKNADLFMGHDATPAGAREMTRAYLASCSYADANVGRVLGELDRLKLRDKTIVVCTADHGYQLGEKGKWSKAGSLFEQGARVPYIIAAPNVMGNGQPCRRIVQSLDFYPTLVELCGLPQPRGLEGVSLVPLLNNPNAEWNHPAYTVWSEDGRSLRGVGVRTEHWRYAEYEDGSGLLLDMDNDPRELKNVAADSKNAAVRAELSRLARAYKAEYRPAE